MKIRNKFLIPLVALLLAILMTGVSVPGTAADTSASQATEVSTSHPLEYVPTTMPPTSSLDEEIDAMISENLGNLAGAEDEIRENNSAMGTILRAIRDFIDSIIETFRKIGDLFTGDFFQGSIIPSTEATESTVAAQ